MKKILAAAVLAAVAMQAQALQTYSWFIHWNGLGDQWGTITFDEAGKADGLYYRLPGSTEYSTSGGMGTLGPTNSYLYFQNGRVTDAAFCFLRCGNGPDLPLWYYWFRADFILDQRGVAYDYRRVFTGDGVRDVYASGITTFVEGSVPLAIPEPGTYALMTLGLSAIALVARRRQQ